MKVATKVSFSERLKFFRCMGLNDVASSEGGNVITSICGSRGRYLQTRQLAENTLRKVLNLPSEVPIVRSATGRPFIEGRSASISFSYAREIGVVSAITSDSDEVGASLGIDLVDLQSHKTAHRSFKRYAINTCEHQIVDQLITKTGFEVGEISGVFWAIREAAAKACEVPLVVQDFVLDMVLVGGIATISPECKLGEMLAASARRLEINTRLILGRYILARAKCLCGNPGNSLRRVGAK